MIIEKHMSPSEIKRNELNRKRHDAKNRLPKVGDIYTSLWEDVSKSTGIKARPVLVINVNGNKATVCEIGGSEHDKGYASEVSLTLSEVLRIGLKKPSTIRLHKQQIMPIAMLPGRFYVNSLDDDTVEYILDKLKKLNRVDLRTVKKKDDTSVSIKHVNEEEEKDEIDSFIDDLYMLRKKGLEGDGEYDIRNLVFKEFRNRGYIDRLKELKNATLSKKLSLEGINKKN